MTDQQTHRIPSCTSWYQVVGGWTASLLSAPKVEGGGRTQNSVFFWGRSCDYGCIFIYVYILIDINAYNFIHIRICIYVCVHVTFYMIPGFSFCTFLYYTISLICMVNRYIYTNWQMEMCTHASALTYWVTKWRTGYSLPGFNLLSHHVVRHGSRFPTLEGCDRAYWVIAHFLGAELLHTS